MIQQMRDTVESGMQAFMEKTKERSKSPLPSVTQPPPSTPVAEPPPAVPITTTSTASTPFQVTVKTFFQLMWTNVQCRSQEARDATDVTVVLVIVDDIPAHGMNPCLQAVLSQSLFARTPHASVKYHINAMNIVNVMITSLHLPPINRNLGTINITTNLRPSTRGTTMINPPTTITVPPTSGSPGSLGRTTPRPNIMCILPDGSTIQSLITKHQSYDGPPTRYPSKPLTAFSLEQHSQTHGNHPPSLWFRSVQSFHPSTWSYCHQPSRRFQRRMGPSSYSCSQPPGEDEAGKST